MSTLTLFPPPAPDFITKDSFVHWLCGGQPTLSSFAVTFTEVREEIQSQTVVVQQISIAQCCVVLKCVNSCIQIQSSLFCPSGTHWDILVGVTGESGSGNSLVSWRVTSISCSFSWLFVSNRRFTLGCIKVLDNIYAALTLPNTLFIYIYFLMQFLHCHERVRCYYYLFTNCNAET